MSRSCSAKRPCRPCCWTNEYDYQRSWSAKKVRSQGMSLLQGGFMCHASSDVVSSVQLANWWNINGGSNEKQMGEGFASSHPLSLVECACPCFLPSFTGGAAHIVRHALRGSHFICSWPIIPATNFPTDTFPIIRCEVRCWFLQYSFGSKSSTFFLKFT